MGNPLEFSETSHIIKYQLIVITVVIFTYIIIATSSLPRQVLLELLIG